jgi:type IX secretion system PorP/SprF family membrane protein
MKKTLVLLWLLQAAYVQAQDVHASQFWTTPLQLNPALTGKFNGTIRGTVNYRTQWWPIPTQNAGGAPYQTIQTSVDASFTSKRWENNKVGVGLQYFNDRAGDGVLATNNIVVSTAYHQCVDRYGRSHLSIGIQGGVVFKQIDFNRLVFENQLALDGSGWNTVNSPNYEPNLNKTIIYPDISAGATFSSKPKDQFAYNFGLALNHLSQPKEYFLSNDSTNKLKIRYVVHAGFDFRFGQDYEWSLLPSVLYMYQGRSQQYNFGLGVNYQMREFFSLYGGAYVRVNNTKNTDAAIVHLGAEYHDVRLGVSYDINVSRLNEASRSQGAFEVSLIYIWRREAESSINFPMYCPKM